MIETLIGPVMFAVSVACGAVLPRFFSKRLHRVESAFYAGCMTATGFTLLLFSLSVHAAARTSEAAGPAFAQAFAAVFMMWVCPPLIPGLGAIAMSVALFRSWK